MKRAHNLILFNPMIHNTNTNLNRIASTSTRRSATQVGNWNLFQQRVQQNSQQWTDLVNRATTNNEQIDKSITIIWGELGEMSKKYFPPFLPKTKYTPWWSPKLNSLTFRHRASSIWDRRLATLQRTLFIYLINKYILLSDICLTVHH